MLDLEARSPRVSQADERQLAFRLFGPADDAAIGRLIADEVVPGRVQLSQDRSPSYFRSCATLGDFVQVGGACHPPSGRVVALGTRAVRWLYVNGALERVGYLGHLRVAKEFQGRWISPRLYRYLRECHEDGQAGAYLTTVDEDNRSAQGLTSPNARRSLPGYRETARLVTLALLPRLVQRPSGVGLELSPGSSAQLDLVADFRQRHGPKRQFFPLYRADDFRAKDGRTLDFQVERLVLARRGGELVGVAGLWDRSASRRSIVRGYGQPLRAARPLLDLGARVLTGRALPQPGEPLHCAYLSFVCVADDDLDVFAALLRAVAAAGRRHQLLLACFDERDPLLAVARRSPHYETRSRLYVVSWDDGESLHGRLDDRPAYVELAAL
jgi:hypothetical protein